MLLQSYVVPLLALVSLAAAIPSNLASYDEGHLNNLNAVQNQVGDPMIYGTVTSISCGRRSFSCTARIRGRRRGRRGRRHWRATWPLRSFGPGQFFGANGQSLNLEADISLANMVGRINQYSIKCDGASNPHVCKGYVGRSAIVAEWQVTVYRQPGTFGPIDGLSEEELDLWTAHNHNLAEEERMSSEMMENGMDTLDEGNDDDDIDTDEEDMQTDEAYDSEPAVNFGPVPVSRMTCSRKTQICVAKLIFGLNNYAAYWYFH